MASTSVVFDILARDRASDKFGKIASSADNTGTKMVRLGHVAKVAMLGLAAGTGVAVLGLAKLVRGAADDEAAQKRLAKTLTNTTGATKDQISSVEDWITAQGKAYGVADDDLRPALDKLAVATGSVSKSQKLASLAMNVSAGTGKDLGAVSAALAKAYTGNVGALGRLGIATKDAHGKTKTFAAIQADLAGKFRGQAATAADTLSGRVGRLKLMLSEAGESLGAKLLPILTQFAGWVLNKAVPAINTFVTQLQTGEGAGGKVAATFQKVASVLGTVFGWISSNKATVGTFVSVIGTLVVVTKTWAIAQAALNIALTANPIGLIVVGLAALAAGLVYAYKHSEKFRTVVQTAFGAVKASAAAVVGFFTSTVPAAFAKVRSAAASALNWVKGNWPLLLGILTGPFGIAAVLIAKNWDTVKNGARTAVNKVTSFFAALPGKITGALGNLGGILTNAGNQIIESLLAPLRAGADKVQGILNGITKKIPDWKGPPSKDRTLLTPAGIAIMDSLLGGLQKRFTPVKDFLQRVTDKVKETGDKLQNLLSTRNDFANSFRGFSSSIFGRDPGQDADGNAIPESVTGIKNFAYKQRQDAERLAANVKRLVGLGLSKDLLMQLQSSGASGISQINTLGASATARDIAWLNNQNKLTAAADVRAGLSAGNAIYGADIAKAKRDADTAKAIAAELSKALKPYLDREMVGKISGDDIIISIRRTQKKKGQKVTV